MNGEPKKFISFGVQSPLFHHPLIGHISKLFITATGGQDCCVHFTRTFVSLHVAFLRLTSHNSNKKKKSVAPIADEWEKGEKVVGVQSGGSYDNRSVP